MFRLTLGLTNAEVEASANCLFLSLAQQVLVLGMVLSKIVFPITNADHKDKAFFIRNRDVDYMCSHPQEFEDWLCYGEGFDTYCNHMRKEDQMGDELILRAAVLALQVDIQVFKLNTETNSITMYQYAARSSQNKEHSSASQILREVDAEMLDVKPGTLNVAHYTYQYDGTVHYNSIERSEAEASNPFSPAVTVYH